MIIIFDTFKSLQEKLGAANDEFNQSQVIRMKHIDSSRQAGELFIEIRNKLKGASKNHPIETDMGTFTSFRHFLESQNLDPKTAYNYIKLAEGWDIVIRLGMQNAENIEDLKNSMRICRTLKIIRWYEKAVAAGRPEAELTLDQYWLDEEAAIEARRQNNQERQVQHEDLAQQLQAAHGELFVANQKLKEVTSALSDANQLINSLKLENLKLKNKSLVTI